MTDAFQKLVDDFFDPSTDGDWGRKMMATIVEQEEAERMKKRREHPLFPFRYIIKRFYLEKPFRAEGDVQDLPLLKEQMEKIKENLENTLGPMVRDMRNSKEEEWDSRLAIHEDWDRYKKGMFASLEVFEKFLEMYVNVLKSLGRTPEDEFGEMPEYWEDDEEDIEEEDEGV